MRLGVDPRKADQMVRGTVNLPHGTGKTARVIVFAAGAKADEAEAAGADVVGTRRPGRPHPGGLAGLRRGDRHAGPDGQDRSDRADPGPARPDAEPEDRHRDDGRHQGRLDIKGGKITFRVDKHSNLHLIIGKASFSRGAAGRQLRRGARRGAAGQAVRGQGQVPQEGHRRHHDGPGIPVDPNVTRNLAEAAE